MIKIKIYIAYINNNATRKLKIPKASAKAIPINIVAV
jgi:hypothetical protein